MNPYTGEVKRVVLPDSVTTVTGLASGGGKYFLGVYDSHSKVDCVYWLNKRLDFEGVFPVSEVSDIHDVLIYRKTMYVVSTGSNSVLMYPLDGSDLPVSLQRNDRVVFNDEKFDALHLNSIAANGKDFFFSMFGVKQEDSWLHTRCGRIVRASGLLWRKENVVEEVAHPHSLRVYSGKLCYCESLSGKVFLPSTEKTLDGYTRGLARDMENFYVGVSRQREVSKSTGQLVDVEDNGVSAGIWILDKNGNEKCKIGLEGWTTEVYDIEVIYDY